jgi:hypothetical protein
LNVAEPEIMPPSSGDPGFDGVRVHIGHVKSLGAIGALLALLTMGAAVGFGLLMLFGRALLSALVVVLAWPFVFSPEFTRWVFGANKAPFWKIFLLLVLVSALAKALRPAAWDRR